MKIKLNRIMTLLILIVGLNACGGGGSGSDGGGSGSVFTLPKEIFFTPPQTNTDDSLLTDLSSYRFYYGSDAGSLIPVFEVDTEGVTMTSHLITSAQNETLAVLIENNTAHLFAMTAVNSQNIESSFSNIVEYQ